MIQPIFAIGRREICQLMQCQDYRTAKRRLHSLHIPIIEMAGKPAVAVKFLETYAMEVSKNIKAKPPEISLPKRSFPKKKFN